MEIINELKKIRKTITEVIVSNMDKMAEPDEVNWYSKLLLAQVNLTESIKMLEVENE